MVADWEYTDSGNTLPAGKHRKWHGCALVAEIHKETPRLKETEYWLRYTRKSQVHLGAQ